MTIMRRCPGLCFLQIVMKKCKRKQVNWYSILFEIGDLRLSEQYWLFKQKHKDMSENRCAYNVLKSNYSTTAMAYCRRFGEFPR